MLLHSIAQRSRAQIEGAMPVIWAKSFWLLRFASKMVWNVMQRTRFCIAARLFLWGLPSPIGSRFPARLDLAGDRAGGRCLPGRKGENMKNQTQILIGALGLACASAWISPALAIDGL